RRSAPYLSAASRRTFFPAGFRHIALRCDRRRSRRLHAAVVGRLDAALGARRGHAGILLPGQSTMRTRLLTPVLIALGTLATAWVAPAKAHHSFAAEFDGSKPITLTGTVTQIDWTNPHVWFYITVKNEDGRTARWAWEMGAPHQLQQRGWLRDTMKVGDVVTVAGSLARDS